MLTRARAIHASQPEIAGLLDEVRTANVDFARDVDDLVTAQVTTGATR